MVIDFATARRRLSRLGARLREGREARFVAFGGGLSYDGVYFSSMVRTLTRAYPSAVFESATRALPEFTSEEAVFRTRSVVDLSPDVVIVEFAGGDIAAGKTDNIVPAVEGIVRQLRASDPDREIIFVYFGMLQQIKDGTMGRVVAEWERVADYYGIPSFDCGALAMSLVEKGTALWFERWPGRHTWAERRPIGLTREGGQHTMLGGAIFGSHVAQSMITMFNPSSLVTESELPSPLDPGHWTDAVWVDASAFNREGWVGGPLADALTTEPIAVYYDQLAAAENAGARVRITFDGRYARLWTLGTGGAVLAELDGRSIEVACPTGELHHAQLLLNENRNRRHVLQIEARRLPAVIAGLELLGQVLPEPTTNG